MFKAPSSLPQDLLLIQDIISTPILGFQNPRHQEKAPVSSGSDSEASSNAGSKSDTEAEEVDVVETLLGTSHALDNEGKKDKRSPSPISSEISGSISDSDSDSDVEQNARNLGGQAREAEVGHDDDEDDGMQTSVGSVLRTKNEVEETVVRIPDISEVDAHEILEKVGEIMSIIDNVVVVKGLPSEYLSRASDRALDSESLLVFDDRKILGYVHDTFGPTSQPLYQVRFPNANLIDKSIVTSSREVFHVPTRSNFVFANRLKAMKGSDASNVHDEEVNEEEIEFSDDEAEAAYKRQRREQREGRRSSSVASSRFSTSEPREKRDFSSFYDASPYDAYGPYDVDNMSGPSRPAPLPYDDPYEDVAPPLVDSTESLQPASEAVSVANAKGDSSRSSARERSRGRGRERGRGRGRGRGDWNRQSRYGPNDTDRRQFSSLGSGSSYGQRNRRDSVSSSHGGYQQFASPISQAAPQATAQAGFSSMLPSGQHSYDTQQLSSATPSYQQQSFVQPHINPRFASMFGIDLNLMQAQQYAPYQPASPTNFSPYNMYQNTPWDDNSWSQHGDFSAGSSHSGQATQNNPPNGESDEYRP